MASIPQFAATPKIGSVVVSTAETSRTAPTNAGTVLTAGSNGTRLNRIQVLATATTTAGTVRLFLHDGTSFRLLAEVPVTAITPSGTVQVFSATLSEATNIDFLPIVLPNGWSLRAATHNAESFVVTAHGADL